MEESTLSYVNIPIILSIKEINAMINKLIYGVFYENGNLADEDTGDVHIKAEKTQDISISFENDHVNYRVPLKIRVKKIIPVTALEVEVEGEIALSFKTCFNIEEDWKFSTQTEFINFDWLQKPHLRLGLFDLPIKFIVNIILKKSKKLVCSTIDQGLIKNFDLQNYMSEAWKILHSPILLSEEYGLWLSLFPKKVGMTPIVADADFIKSTIMVQTYANALIGEQPKIVRDIPLPPFQFSANIKEDFYLYLMTKTTFADAENIARKYLIGQTFSKGRRSVNVLDVKINRKEDNLAVEIRLTGAYKGSVLVEGKPVFDMDKNEIEIKNPEYKLHTRNLLIRFFNWLFYRFIIKWLKRHLHFQLTENLNEVMNLLEKKLENFEVKDNVFLNGNLSKLKVESIQMDEKSLMVTIISSGKLSLFINKIAIQNEAEN